MIKKLFNKLVRIVSQSALATDLRNRRRFPGVAIHSTANMAVEGKFCSKGAIISSWSQIVVPQGATLDLGDGCYIGRNVELGPVGRIQIGNRTSIQDRCIILGDVQIGDHCVFAPNIYISSGLHHFDDQPWALIKDQDEQAATHPERESLAVRQVVIEDDCWLGVNVVVMRGVKIGKGAVIGANAVVTRDVAPYTVLAGIPARELRKRLDFKPPKEIHWDVEEHMPYFYSGLQVAQAQRVRHASLGGLVAGDAVFRLALDQNAGGSLSVTVKLSRPAERVKLRYGETCHAVSEEFQELTFAVPSIAYLHAMEIEGLPPDGGTQLIVQSARRL